MTHESHPVLACARAVEFEKKLLKGEPAAEWRAMTRAGVALGRALLADYLEIGPVPERPRLLVLAGKGHNAGDALIGIREVLSARPRASIDVLFLMGEENLNDLARRAWSDLLGAVGGAAAINAFSIDRRKEVVSQLKARCGGRYDLCLDGLFGMNFRPPFRAPLDEVVRWINDELDVGLRAAVDLPSGLSDEPADLALRADFSYMTGSAKEPLFQPSHARWAGRLRYLDLGFFAGEEERPEQDAGEARGILVPRILQPLRGLRGSMMHKRGYGHLLVVGGSRLMPGAILMSIMAAAQSGVGLLTAAVPETLVPAFSTVVPEAMWIGCPETEDGGLAAGSLSLISRVLPKATALLLGPGVGTEPETQAFLEELAGAVEVPVVMDAEALQRKVVGQLVARDEMRGKVAVTPHAGEFLRMSGRDFSEVGEGGLISFCRETGLLTLLKGPPFSRFCDGRKILYGLAGGPVLARGGSGDVLSGIAGSLVAQAPDQVGPAVCRALVWHGLAAEALARESGQVAVRTTQLLEYLSGVLRDESGADDRWRSGN